MILYIVRHAAAVPYGDPDWPDFDRPLTEKGIARFSQFIQALATADFAPGIVATSPLVRCRQTAEILSRMVSRRPPVVAREELAPASDLSGLTSWVAQAAADCDQVAWVGHAPDVGHLAAALIGHGSSQIHFSKGAVAAIQFDGLPARGEGELCWLAMPKLLGC
ncbi:MAG: SixA phosphatase family protein [Thermoguttaceae bacterium]|jgi:phosphohistidine phosphatase